MLENSNFYPNKMNLPNEIWTLILKNTNQENTCKNLFASLPKYIQKEIHPEYIKHLETFQEHICVCLKKKVIVYRIQEKINTFSYNDDIHMIKFIPESSKVVIATQDGNILIWDYLSNQTEIFFSSPIKSYFEMSPCGNYLAIFPKYTTDNLIYIYKLKDKTFKTINFPYNSEEIKIQILFNPVNTELTILSYYFTESFVSNHFLKIINYQTMQTIYSSYEEFYKCYYDKYGNLYTIQYRKGFFFFDGEMFINILKYSNFIIDFIVEDEFIYFSDYARIMDKNHLIKYNIENKKMNVLFLSEHYPIKQIRLSLDKDKLIFKSIQKIIFLKLSDEREKNEYVERKIYLEENFILSDNEEIPVIEDYDLKNFYKKLIVYIADF